MFKCYIISFIEFLFITYALNAYILTGDHDLESETPRAPY
jgi:hypothetical protein